ncbi:hypothetical protein A2U01_0061327 [Trifolium medium]|uniref:Retrotransposon gag domain-containing protein n=1 Tax=Trifolium medium TaxID=97028 RepID=A0A392RWV7_9FABA|nr:hypothetical protein [Trifolium medium]
MLLPPKMLDAWDILQKSYMVVMQALKRQYELLQMKNDETFADYFTRLVTLVTPRTNYP